MTVSPDKIMAHVEPAWRAKANYAAYVQINDGNSEYESSYTHEQLALQKLEDGKFIVCCIPFLIYDVNLGDEISLEGVNIKKLVDGNHYGFRLYLGDGRIDASFLDDVIKSLIESGACVERSVDARLLSVDVDNERSARRLAGTLARWAEQGLIVEYETIRTA